MAAYLISRFRTGQWRLSSQSNQWWYFGGKILDLKLIDHLLKGFQSEHGIDLADEVMMQRLREEPKKQSMNCQVHLKQKSIALIATGENGPVHLEFISTDALEDMVGD